MLIQLRSTARLSRESMAEVATKTRTVSELLRNAVSALGREQTSCLDPWTT
jgi:hypothetical protein